MLTKYFFSFFTLSQSGEIEVFGTLENQTKPIILWKFSMGKQKNALDIETFQTEVNKSSSLKNRWVSCCKILFCMDTRRKYDHYSSFLTTIRPYFHLETTEGVCVVSGWSLVHLHQGYRSSFFS